MKAQYSVLETDGELSHGCVRFVEPNCPLITVLYPFIPRLFERDPQTSPCAYSEYRRRRTLGLAAVNVQELDDLSPLLAIQRPIQ